MRHSKYLAAGFVFITIFVTVGCKSTTSMEANMQFTETCAEDQLASDSVLYFGPSNQIGPGSIWSRLGPNGGYQPQWRVKDLKLDDARVVERGKDFPCSFSKNSVFAANAGLSVLSQAANASAELKADLSRAKNISVSANSVAWDTVIAGPYRVELHAIPDAVIKSDVFGKNRLVVRRALRVSGYKATLDFDAGLKPELKAKYNGVKLGPQAVGDVGAQLSANWSSDDKLELSAPEDIYVAGEFAELFNGDFVSTKGGGGVIEDLGDKIIEPYSGSGK